MGVWQQRYVGAAGGVVGKEKVDKSSSCALVFLQGPLLPEEKEREGEKGETLHSRGGNDRDSVDSFPATLAF